MDIKEATSTAGTANPKLRALVKQIANLIQEARAEQTWLDALATWTPEGDMENRDREIDQRWQTIEQLVEQLFDHRPSDLDEAAAQATVGLALSNAGNWDEDHYLTLVARNLAVSGRAHPHAPYLSEALAKITPVQKAPGHADSWQERP
jgi:hypothetical protein